MTFLYLFSGMHKVFYLLRSLKPSDHPINYKDIWWEPQQIVFILTWNSTSGLYVSIVWGKRGKRGWKWTKHAMSWSKFILDDESKRFCLTYFRTKTEWSARKEQAKKTSTKWLSRILFHFYLDEWMIYVVGVFPLQASMLTSPSNDLP